MLALGAAAFICVATEIMGAGGAAVADASDVSTAEGSQRAVDAAVNEFGRVDILAANHGVISYSPVDSLTDRMMMQAQYSNVRGVEAST